MRRSHFLLVLLLISRCGFAADQGTVARMGDITLTLSEARALAKEFPRESKTAQGLEKLIRTEIIRRGVIAEARKQAFDKKPEVAARMERASEQALVASYMNGIAQPPADYPSEALLKQAYEANKNLLMSAPRFRVSQIFIPGTDDKARQAADDIARQARRKGADFAALARKYSKHPASAAKGGELGWVDEPDLAPAFRQALLGLSKGEVATPAAGPQGWHVLRMDERKDPELQPFDKVRDALARRLRLNKAREIERAYLDAMLKREPISLNGIALGEIANP